ncbi:MAG: hypothetical protein IPO37_07165 [Saprospiraceae bacterium]|nr:hypothetical protein [Saprospiraceae bacterium]
MTLTYIKKRDWPKIGQKNQKEKSGYTAGDMDNYYLNNAVFLLKNFSNPPMTHIMMEKWITATVAEHCEW